MTDDPLATGAEAPEVDEPEPAPDPVAPLSDDGDTTLLGLIDRFAAILERSELTELEVEIVGTGLTLRKPTAFEAPAASSPGAPATASAGAGDGAAPAASPAARPSVKAPLTGIWYGSPSPGSAPYVEVGGEVAVGQVIGLIEAMKLFNEIKSDLSGRIVRVVAENGKLVKAKGTLIEVEPL